VGRLASQWWGVTLPESTPERPIGRVVPLFPKADRGARTQSCGNQSWGMTWAQIAIIPTNNVIDASAAASSTKILNMAYSLARTYEEHCSHFVLGSQAVSAISTRDG
jgi:hypothetical protein